MAIGQRPGDSAITDGRMDYLLGTRYPRLIEGLLHEFEDV